jgi:hypothetical protein
MMKLVPGLSHMKRSAKCGLTALRIEGCVMIWETPRSAMAKNQASVIGPKKRPMPAVPCFCTAKRQNSTTSVMGIT